MKNDLAATIGKLCGIVALLAFYSIAFVVIVGGILGVAFGIFAFWTWAVSGVAAGLFGVHLPFWPLFGFLWLLSICVGWLSLNTVLGRRK